jgi:hypothetical protein
MPATERILAAQGSGGHDNHLTLKIETTPRLSPSVPQGVKDLSQKNRRWHKSVRALG